MMSDSGELTVVPKKIGGSLAIFIPADAARDQDLKPGIPIRITIHRPSRTAVLGFLKGKIKYTPFDRHVEGDYPDD